MQLNLKIAHLAIMGSPMRFCYHHKFKLRNLAVVVLKAQPCDIAITGVRNSLNYEIREVQFLNRATLICVALIRVSTTVIVIRPKAFHA